MRRIGRNKAKAVTLVVVALALTVVSVAGAAKITFQSGIIKGTFEGGISPKALPKKGPGAPLTLKLGGKMETTDGSHIAPVDTISLDFDKAGKIYAKGLPTCTVGKLESTVTAQAKSACGKALVGTGNVTADISLPEQKPFGAAGPLLVFNGPPKGGQPSLILHVHANVPAPTTFVVPVKISKAGGKYGTNAFIKVPKIVSGDGSVTSFKAKIGKKFTSGGKKQSLLSANCKTGKLFVNGDFKFVGGARLKGAFSETCSPKG